LTASYGLPVSEIASPSCCQMCEPRNIPTRFRGETASPPSPATNVDAEHQVRVCLHWSDTVRHHQVNLVIWLKAEDFEITQDVSEHQVSSKTMHGQPRVKTGRMYVCTMTSLVRSRFFGELLKAMILTCSIPFLNPLMPSIYAHGAVSTCLISRRFPLPHIRYQQENHHTSKELDHRKETTSQRWTGLPNDAMSAFCS